MGYVQAKAVAGVEEAVEYFENHDEQGAIEEKYGSMAELSGKFFRWLVLTMEGKRSSL